MFEKIKFYFTEGLWTKEQVHKVVGKAITEAEYKKLTAEEYEAAQIKEGAE